MKIKNTVLLRLNRMLARLGQVHWRNPLLQTWSLVGGLLIVCIGAHYGRREVPGEKKNLHAARELLRSGHLGVTDHWKPAVVFSPGAAYAPDSNPALHLDLRAFVNRAAGEPAWQFLAAELRDKMA